MTGGKATKHIVETIAKVIFLICAAVAIVAVLSITVYMFAKGTPALAKVGVIDLLFGTVWQPTAATPSYGILYIILTSIAGTAVAILIGVPIGVLTAAFMAKFCPKKLYRPLKAGVELLAGIPSIVYGFFGLVVLVPFVKTVFGGNGNSMLTASILLGIMILPTIIGVSESAIRSVPESYYEGALALGATKERSIFTVILPAAKSGILAGVILGIGRAIGETMAVIMVAGNQARMPSSILKGVRTLTSNIVIEMGYAADLHREVLIATGVVLFVFILLINISFSIIKGRNKA